ncbi:hypothetical protein FRC03_004624 [Tulasnella sp. 419]|nr:hypothetical protein FRC03_004624 [Tulasnella sp. 419]
MAPSWSHSTQTSSPLPLPAPMKSVMDALWLVIFMHNGHTVASDNDGLGLDPSTDQLTSQNLSATPDSIASRAILQELKGTSADSLIYDNLDNFDSTTPIPELTTSLIKRTLPTPTFSLDPSLENAKIDCPSPKKGSLEVEMQELRTRVAALEQKALRYEAQLFLQDLYCWKSQMKLFTKEKRAKTARELLCDAGKCEMTAEEWIQALEDEVTEKSRMAALKAAKRRWKEEEKRERMEQFEKEVATWKIVVAECRA